MGRYISNELFHFVGNGHACDDSHNYEILLAILRDGCVSHPPHVRGWGETSIRSNLAGSILTDKLFVPTVTCYCDIPIEHLAIHVRKYGRFGLSFSADRLIRYGARPVIYVPTRPDDRGSPFGTTLLRNIEGIYRGFHEQHMKRSPMPPHRTRALGSIPTTPESAAREMHNLLVKDFLAFVKPFNSELSQDEPEYYYSEREWRKYGNLMFTPKEVKRVLVAGGFIDRLVQEQPEYEHKIEVI